MTSAPRGSTTCSAFFQTYYRPRNASLALAGDIDTDKALALATDYFGDSTAATEPPPVVFSPPPAIASEVRLSPRGSRRAAAPVYRVALAGALRRRRRRARSRRRGARERQDVASVSDAGVRAAHRHRDRRVAELARDRRLTSRSSRPRRPAARWRSSSARSREEMATFVDGRADGGRNGAVPGAGGSALHLPAADRRRVRRQSRDQLNAYNVVRRRSRVLRRRSRALSDGHARGDAARGARRGCGPRRASCSASSRAAAPALALDGSQPVAVA